MRPTPTTTTTASSSSHVTPGLRLPYFAEDRASLRGMCEWKTKVLDRISPATSTVIAAGHAAAARSAVLLAHAPSVRSGATVQTVASSTSSGTAMISSASSFRKGDPIAASTTVDDPTSDGRDDASCSPPERDQPGTVSCDGLELEQQQSPAAETLRSHDTAEEEKSEQEKPDSVPTKDAAAAAPSDSGPPLAHDADTQADQDRHTQTSTAHRASRRRTAETSKHKASASPSPHRRRGNNAGPAAASVKSSARTAIAAAPAAAPPIHRRLPIVNPTSSGNSRSRPATPSSAAGGSLPDTSWLVKQLVGAAHLRY